MRAGRGDRREATLAEGPSPTAPQLRRLLDAVAPDPSGGAGAEIPTGVLAGLARLVPCAGIGYFEVDPRRRAPTSTQFVPAAATPRAKDSHARELFLRACRDRAACRPPQSVGRPPPRSTDPGDADAVVARHRRSDRSELVVRLPDRAGTSRRIILIRDVDDPPFDERDQLVLTVLQPHVTAIRDGVEARRDTLPALTARQVQLLRHVARGETNRQIGRRLGVTESTVRTHLQHIYARLEAHSRTEAVALASPLLRAGDLLRA